ncbi:MAG: phosphoenolpyruvate carboxykinase (GTP) [Oligoflexia bacterium]|nr:phosphoenolpyruvate carboxykinase (GTP) [Oligoflexia bacterium]
MTTKSKALREWVEEMAKLCKPDLVYWCDGSEVERQTLVDQALKTGELELLNQSKLPGCVYHRSNANDVARVEQCTFICTDKKEDAGPTNNWMAPADAYKKVGAIFDGSMRGRTMYVVPFIMGPAKSPFSKVGVEITDSIYVVLNMRTMTRMGKIALDQLGESDNFTKGLHGKADLNPERRFICHFPQDNAIWSVGSGYGGNALLGKKCLSLRIASYLGRQEDWMAEHMLILGIENPQGKTSYVAAAFPSACGKTNLAMLIPPKELKGYKVWTVGDDIAWLRKGTDGRLWAVNPEAGFFGVLPGTSHKTNPNAMLTMQKNTIYTNVVKTTDGNVWWEGHSDPAPHKATDWLGREWTPSSKEKGAHANSRFTAPASQCPSISPNWESPEGVPISAIIFGGRRARVAPLVYESFSWQHGVYMGATMASETTAAAIGQTGVVRRDPMAMLPFIGYNAGDYFAHWLHMGKITPKPPRIFNVNWFRTNANGEFMWPGYGDNMRVLLWILGRCDGKVEAQESPIGHIPFEKDLDLTGLNLKHETLKELLSIDRASWREELSGQKEFLDKIGPRLPSELHQEWQNLTHRLFS